METHTGETMAVPSMQEGCVTMNQIAVVEGFVTNEHQRQTLKDMCSSMPQRSHPKPYLHEQYAYTCENTSQTMTKSSLEVSAQVGDIAKMV